MPLSYQDLVIPASGKGIISTYLNVPNDFSQILDNFYITDTGSYATREGFEVEYERETAERIMGLWEVFNDIFTSSQNTFMYKSGGKIYDLSSGVATEVTFPYPTSHFQNNDVTNYPDSFEWQEQLYISSPNNTLNRPVKVYNTQFTPVQIKGFEIGMPSLESTPVLTGTGSLNLALDATTYPNVYIFKFHNFYRYQIGTKFFEVVGPISEQIISTDVEIGSGGGANGVNINASASFIPTSGNQFDRNGVYRIDAYRTIKDGTVAHIVSSLTLGSPSITTGVPDSTIVNGSTIYNSDGSFDRYPAPKCKYMTLVNNKAYYAYVEDPDSLEVEPFKVVQSFPNIPDSTHPSFSVESDDTIVGISNIAGFPILFTKTFIYRLEGQVNADGTGSIRKRVISETVGCVSNGSPVRVNDRLYFIAETGIHVTNGYNVDYVPTGKNLDDLLNVFLSNDTRRNRVTGSYDRQNERIIWAMSDSDVENNRWLILDMKTMGITTASGVSLQTSCILFPRDGGMKRGDEEGYVYNHAPDIYSDKQRDVSIPSNGWGEEHIPFDWRSVGQTMGSSNRRKWGTHLTVNIKANTDFAYVPYSINDDGPTVEMKEVRSFGNLVWNDPSFVWNNTELQWRKKELVSSKRHFPRGKARFRYKQVGIRPKEVILYNSDSFGLMTLSYVVITDPSEVYCDLVGSWPTAIEGQAIYVDGFKYTIQERVTDTRIRATGNGATTGSDKTWYIEGFNKRQRIELKLAVIKYAFMEDEGTEYSSGESGANSA